MKLRYLATVVVLALTTVAAHAQKVRVTSDSISVPSSPASATQWSIPVTTAITPSSVRTPPPRSFGATTSAATTTSYHAGNLNAGLDVRFSDQHANNAMLKNILVGVRLAADPFTRPFKPYVEAAVRQWPPPRPRTATVHVGKSDYGLFAESTTRCRAMSISASSRSATAPSPPSAARRLAPAEPSPSRAPPVWSTSAPASSFASSVVRRNYRSSFLALERERITEITEQERVHRGFCRAMHSLCSLCFSVISHE